MNYTDAVVVVDGLTCRYADYVAVNELSFAVRRGELYALLGTNGAGKTTVVETIEGHRAATSGSVSVFGGEPGDRKQVRPSVGMMIQDSGFAPDLTVKESLDLLGNISGRTDDAAAVLDSIGLTERSSVRVGQLSGGERRRLDFASAIYGRPDLLVLDEPTTALDPEARDRLWDIVNQFRANGVTILLTTHYLEEAEDHADRIGLMHRGELKAEGSVRDLVRNLPSRIEFESDFIPEDLPVPFKSIGGDRVVIATEFLQRDLHKVLEWASDSGVELRRLRAVPAGLAEVFRHVASGSMTSASEVGKEVA